MTRVEESSVKDYNVLSIFKYYERQSKILVGLALKINSLKIIHLDEYNDLSPIYPLFLSLNKNFTICRSKDMAGY